jgi:hypothetical protein
MTAGKYFLIIFLIICFGLLYVYINNMKQKEKFAQECVKNKYDDKYLIPPDKLAVVQGLNMPLDKIPIVGPADNPEMFLFANNKASPDCCPSPYSTSRGCVCITENQINEVSQRGTNNSYRKCESTW